MKVNGVIKRTVSGALAALLLLAAGCGKGAEPAGILKETNILEETVIFKGIEKEYELLFITDTHGVIRDGEAEEAVAAYAQERYSQFCNGEGMDSQAQFEAYIRYANERQVDGVLLGGDIIDSPSAANLAWLAGQLGQLNMPYLYVPGNHDWTYPWEYMTQAGRETYLPLLEAFMNGNTSIQKMDFGEFVIVGVDDSTGQVDAAALPEYEKILAEGRPVITMAHVPFMTQSVLARAREAWSSPVVIGAGNFGGIYPNEDSARFVELTTAADSPVELVLAGHVHFYDRDVIEGEKDVLQIVGGAGFQGNAILIHVTGAE